MDNEPSQMSSDDVAMRVAGIRVEAARDDESAHGLEDTLHQDVLREIAATGSGRAADLAREALKTLEIDFSRWCA